MTRNALAPYLTDMGGYDQEQIPAQYMQPELRAYQPTWRDTLASWLMPDERASPEQSRLVEGLTGSRGLGNTGMGLVDFVPGVGNAFQAQEEARRGENANMAFAIFGGPAAKTANLSALSKAEMLAKQGAPREQIWSETGWFKGVDGKWRFEIDDSAASPAIPTRQWIERRNGVPMAPSLGGAYASAMAPGASGPLKLQSLLSHGEMKSAYPDIMTEPTSLLREGSPSKGMYGRRMVDGNVRNEFGFNEALPPRDFKSVALHEGQHAVQDREAFARGGNLNGFTPDQISAERARILQADDGSGWGSVNTAAGDMPDTEIARRLYNRLAGEVEARTVQKRLDYTPEQRASRPPWLDYDVPESDQIVRFGGSGPQLSTGNALSPPGIKAYHGSPHDAVVDEYLLEMLKRGQ